MIDKKDKQQIEDERYMRIALEEAEAASKEGEIPIGAVIVSHGRIIGRGHNMTEALTDVTAHAEMLAITAAANNLGGKYLPDCTLYVTIEPCPMCAGAIGWSQIGRLVYGAPDEKRGCFNYYSPTRTPLHPKTIVKQGVLEDECREIMQSFFRKLRR